MGTNFYFITKEKELAEKLAPGGYELTDVPFFGYEIHLAKTSCGWLPLFQGYKGGIESVSDMRDAYNKGGLQIFDEYQKEYSWEDFVQRVLNHNGGVNGKVKKVFYEQNKSFPCNDPDMPDYLPVSHFDYGKGKYAHMYYKDKQGYEFCYQWFS